jgi:uncharacterized protein YyaL (SSP411 family)
MLASFAEAARVLEDERYRQVAIRNANFILGELRSDDQLYRIHSGGAPKIRGHLEDYACLADGVLALYEATFDQRWFLEARALVDEMIPRFKDSPGAGFYDTDGGEALITRPRRWDDNPLPSGNSMAADVLLRLAALTGDGEYAQLAEEILTAMSSSMTQHPLGFGHLLSALDFHLAPSEEIAIMGDPASDDTRELLTVVYEAYRPGKVVAVGLPNDDGEEAVPLLAGRPQLDGRATAYVCQHFACQAPVTDPQALAVALKRR